MQFNHHFNRDEYKQSFIDIKVISNWCVKLVSSNWFEYHDFALFILQMYSVIW